MSNLLPSGFADLFGPSADKHYDIEYKLISFFRENNYSLYIPSLFDYDNNGMANNFKLVDPLDNKILSIRSDITKQVSRLFKEKEFKIEKFCYKGDIYIRKAQSGSFDRKYTQIGVESVRNENEDLAQIKLLIDAIKTVKVNDFTISLALPRLFAEYINAKNLTQDEKTALLTILKNKYKWGFNKYYNLSAKYKIHPTYIQKILNISKISETKVIKIINNLKDLNSKNFTLDNYNRALLTK